MSRVGIADLKARLSEHLRSVRGGRTLTIVDRDRPVARIVPYDEKPGLQVRRASRRPSDLPVPARTGQEDRQPGRAVEGSPLPVIAYVDTSALLRHALSEAGTLEELRGL